MTCKRTACPLRHTERVDKDQKLQVRLSQWTLDALTRMAKAEGLTVSQAVRDAINDWMSQRTPGHRLPHGRWPSDRNEALELYAQRQADLLRQLRMVLSIDDADGDLEKLINNAPKERATDEAEE